CLRRHRVPSDRNPQPRLPVLIIFQILSVLRRSGWSSLLHDGCGRKTSRGGGERDNLTLFSEELLGKDVVEHFHGGSFYADKTSHFISFSDMPADVIRFPIMPYCSTLKSAPDTRLRHSPLPHRTALPEFNG